MLPRRPLLIAAAAAGAPAWSRDAVAPVLLMRHAQTDPGVGDPPGFVLGRCSTQRNLSAEGRAQARAFGARLVALGLRPTAIRSSRWCRCLHTGDEISAALGGGATKTEPWTALDSFFGDRSREPTQSAALRERLATMSGPRFELWVTHQVNISAFAGGVASMGEAMWVGAKADRSLATTPFS